MSLNNTIRSILESKIHQSFTLAADDLAMRGYLTRDERIALSSIIGDILGEFGNRISELPSRTMDLQTSVGDIDVSAYDVDWIASKQAQKAIGAGLNAVEKQHDGIQVFKDTKNKLRWVAFSSNAFQDYDGEIVSLKALKDDCDRADMDGVYGPLRWWHVKGLDLGDCDFNMVHGKVLVESGTFYNEEIGQKIKEISSDLQVSIGFLHPVGQPDERGVYKQIRRVERSILPKGTASNFLTAFM